MTSSASDILFTTIALARLTLFKHNQREDQYGGSLEVAADK